MRGTGRTERMLMAAIKMAGTGESVIIICANVQHGERLAQRILSVPTVTAREGSKNNFIVEEKGNIAIMSPAIAPINWRTGWVEGYPNWTVLADHHAIETELAWALSQLEGWNIQ